ncbi:hypothetical protein BO83DRAFT_431761 [Aspergillus eucalypticola CBS 122712]|uniref:Uncharacterized protein n=1 Tax=Aspergillus eucalypticola (strain CBS 122712 / IBT 29274) TaxID=1448314 RepID=A0A317UTA3_ASPEC|nr:uncharacterized protein BO83DRAFT_431761 [Aspergillus eucalypticola CBS 122712]PWY63320.1 hypothetical protein BO83DRAFT_431761 [Aspergillus eucalypticola CBS 122712]
MQATERWQRVDQERVRFEDEAADRQGSVVIDSDSVIRLSSVAENLGGLFPDLENSGVLRVKRQFGDGVD